MPRALIALLLVGAGACVDAEALGPADNPTHVHDSSGAGFDWLCGPQGCEPVADLAAPPSPPCQTSEQSIYSYTAGRFVIIVGACHTGMDWYTYGIWGRPLRCDHDADCPQLYDLPGERRYECRNALCQHLERDVDPAMLARVDAYALCYAPFPRDQTLMPFTPASVQASSRVDEACGQSAVCALPLPSGCLEP